MWVFCAMIYQLANPELAVTARQVNIHKASRFSDHAPLTVEYALTV